MESGRISAIMIYNAGLFDSPLTSPVHYDENIYLSGSKWHHMGTSASADNVLLWLARRTPCSLLQGGRRKNATLAGQNGPLLNS